MNQEMINDRNSKAYYLHNRILANGKTVQTALIDMCRDLKAMKEEELFRELGFDDFEQYAEQACGIKRRQAYSYIAAYEKLGESFLKENAALGITKLELISQISSYEREEFLSETDVENASTRELKKQVDEFKNRVEQLTLDLTEKEEHNNELQDQIRALEADLNQVPITGVTDETAVENAVKEAIAKTEEASKEKIADLKRQLSEEKKKRKAEKTEKEAAVKAAKDEVLKEANEKIDKMLAEKSSLEEKLEKTLKSAKAANADEDLTAVRFLFTQLQSTANRITEHLSKLKDKNPEQADKLKSVMCETLAKISSSMEEII